MNMTKSLSFLVAAGLMLFAGCAKKQPFETVDKICVDNLGKADAIQIAEDVLSKMHFATHKIDVELGIITTSVL